MKAGGWGWVVTVGLVALLGTEAEAGRTLREFSGDAMQRHDSQMMTSPLMGFPGLFGGSLWPDIAYPLPPSRMSVNVQIQLPELNEPLTPPPTPHAQPKFWTARCGVFVELEVNSTMNLMEEETKPCSP
jgi:hypothetical protein